MTGTVNLPKAGSVYVVRSGATSFYKIGCSAEVEKRLAQLQLLSPQPLELVAEIPADDMYAMEKEYHSKYADKRRRGEWFELNLRDIADICRDGALRLLHEVYRIHREDGMSHERAYASVMAFVENDVFEVIFSRDRDKTPATAVEWNAS